MSGGGFVLWFTGLSGAGKSTLASLTAVALRARGVTVEILDGDEIRTHLSKGLGFSREDRDTSVRRIGYVAKVVARVGACAITAAISPYRATRDEIRAQIEAPSPSGQKRGFVEVYLACDVPVLAARDPKGLYEKALRGEIKNFTGVDDPYEPPTDPEITLDTASMDPESSAAAIVKRLEALGYLEAREAPTSPLVAPVGEIPVVADPGAAARSAGPVEHVDLASDDERAILAWIASGACAPVSGPLGERDLVRIAKEGRLERGTLFDAELAIAAVPHGGSSPPAGATAKSERVVLRDAGVDVARIEGGKLVECALAVRGLAGRVRAALVERGARRVAALFVDRPLHAGDVYLARVAAESCDAVLVVLLAGAGAPTADHAQALLDADGMGARALVVELPLLPKMAAGGLPLTRAVAARNLGATEVVLVDGDDALDARRADVEKELELVLRPRVATYRSGNETRSERTRPPAGTWERIAR